MGIKPLDYEPAGASRFTYMGVEKEEATDFHETDHRSYDAQLGRLHQVDKLASMFVGITPYQYAYNNPTMFNDPTGLAAMPSNSDDEPKDVKKGDNYDEGISKSEEDLGYMYISYQYEDEKVHSINFTVGQMHSTDDANKYTFNQTSYSIKMSVTEGDGRVEPPVRIAMQYLSEDLSGEFHLLSGADLGAASSYGIVLSQAMNKTSANGIQQSIGSKYYSWMDFFVTSAKGKLTDDPNWNLIYDHVVEGNEFTEYTDTALKGIGITAAIDGLFLSGKLGNTAAGAVVKRLAWAGVIYKAGEKFVDYKENATNQHVGKSTILKTFD
jgi:RHS repeat-associated protein